MRDAATVERLAPTRWQADSQAGHGAALDHIPPATELTVLIADGDPCVRQELRAIVAVTRSVRCLGEVALGSAVASAVVERQPDVVLLGARLSGLSGIDVLAQIGARVPTIVVASTSEHAARALDLGALDFIVTPLVPGRLAQALARARAIVADVADGPVRVSPRSGLCFRRVFVCDGSAKVPLPTTAIERIEAADDAVLVFAGGRSYTMSVPLHWIERRLDARTFVRLHRSHLVNLDHILSWVPHDLSRVKVTMRSGATLMASRQRSRLLRAWGR